MYSLAKKIVVLICCWGFFSELVVAADNSSKNKLNGLLHRISTVKTDLMHKEQQQASVEQQLGNLKKKIVGLEKRYGVTTRNIKQQKDILAKLLQDQAKQRVKLQEVHNVIATQIKLAYQTESPDVFVALFDREKSIKSDLILPYHQYVVLSHFEQMINIKAMLERLEHNRQKIKRQTKELELTESKQQQQKLELEKTKQDYGRTLKLLKNKIVTQNQRLKQLLLDKKNLEKLIATLTSRQIRAVSPATRTRLCRNFIWPTPGLIVNHFGSSIRQSSWISTGIMISASEHQEIHAMSAGKVVYAGLLAGYGLLLIIDHENGYMSLYGYNSKLHKGLRDNVKAGEVVATVGINNSEEPGLYFAIRYNGKPINPEKWCR